MTTMLGGEKIYVADVAEGTPPSDVLVSSIRVWHGPTHELVRIWNRGAFAGALIMTHGDGARLAESFGLVIDRIY